MEYNLSLAGGTFDHLHQGHKAFLRFIFSLSQKAIIAVTTDEYVAREKKIAAQSFEERKNAVEKFLLEEGLVGRFEIVPIHDIYGVSLDKNILADALIATDDTKENAAKINHTRQEKGLKKLSLVIMPLMKDPSGNIYSSTTIRAYMQMGHGYINPDWKIHDYILPISLRSQLQKPFGEIITAVPTDIDPARSITVGDVTTREFNTYQIGQALSIVDFIVERHETYHNLSELEFEGEEKIFQLTNPAGKITSNAWDSIEHAIQVSHSERVVLHVNGEEDLLVLPCLLLAPNNWHIFYGQPRVGMVHIVVTKEAKEHASAILQQFTASH